MKYATYKNKENNIINIDKASSLIGIHHPSSSNQTPYWNRHSPCPHPSPQITCRLGPHAHIQRRIQNPDTYIFHCKCIQLIRRQLGQVPSQLFSGGNSVSTLNERGCLPPEQTRTREKEKLYHGSCEHRNALHRIQMCASCPSQPVPDVGGDASFEIRQVLARSGHVVYS